jgi:signal transduction histidine kinase/CheY-like chemotaxis protein
VAEIERLQQQIEDLKMQLAKERRTSEILKKRAVQAIINGKNAEQEAQDHRDCATGLIRAELASRVKSTFFENVSHEIRSSMNAIIGMTNLVLDTQLSPEQRQYLEMVSSSVDRLLVVVNEVLDFSRIENGELLIEPEDFNLKESLDHDLYLLNLTAQKKNLTLTCTIAPEVPAYIHGDPARLVQILTNLVDNGIKYTDQGNVTINIENCGYDHTNVLRLKFVVKDTGRGIPSEKLDLINHYFKEKVVPNISLPLSIGSTGLGLTISSQLVKMMGGAIDVASGPSGSIFSFELPFKEVSDVASQEEKANATFEGIKENTTYVLQGAKVLLAEDEPINRTLIKTILQQLGIHVVAVDNGQAAIEEALSGAFQLVIMDVQMEGIDGLEATRAIRKHERKHGGHIDIIALTALAMPGDREKCLQAGMDDYLSKPLERSQLIEVLTKFLTSRALVVAENPISQNVLIQTLIEAGWQVTLAETSRVAMYEASLTHFDLILLDTSTPHLESMKIAKLLRQLEEYSGQRALIIGVGEAGKLTDLRSCGFDGMVDIPVTKEKILKHLKVSETV